MKRKLTKSNENEIFKSLRILLIVFLLILTWFVDIPIDPIDFDEFEEESEFNRVSVEEKKPLSWKILERSNKLFVDVDSI